MTDVIVKVGIVAERRAIDNPWIDHVWEAVAVLPDVPEAPDWTCLHRGEGVERFYIGAAEVELTVTNTAQYRDNLMMPPPRYFVALRESSGAHPIEIAGVTVDPMEAESYTEAVGTLVAGLPMDAGFAAVIAQFVDTHHVERAFVKRQRKRHRDGEGAT